MFTFTQFSLVNAGGTVHVCDCSAENICDANKKKLVFAVKKGTDQSIFWRTTVRIKCCKVSV